MIKPAPGKKYDDFQLAYALDLLRGKMTVASVTKSSNGGPSCPHGLAQDGGHFQP